MHWHKRLPKREYRPLAVEHVGPSFAVADTSISTPSRRASTRLLCSAGFRLSARDASQFHEAEQPADAVGRDVARAVPEALAHLRHLFGPGCQKARVS